MSFLPEDDQAYLESKEISYEELVQEIPGSEPTRAVLLKGLAHAGNLSAIENGTLAANTKCDVLILIPKGYPTTRLDCFYTDPVLKRPDGNAPSATGEADMFQRHWMFWSRHLLGDQDWRPGIDGLNTYVPYILSALKSA
jgi:hypothetical protein